MSGTTQIARGNIILEMLFAVPLTPNGGTAIAANTSVENTYTLPGVALNDFLEINKNTHQTGLSIGNIRASAANTIAIQWINSTTASITPTADTFLIALTRAEGPSLPSALQQ